MAGTALPTRISSGLSGVTSNWSKVPCSRSRATESAASMRVWIMLSVAISPGMMFQRVSRLGLNQARVLMRTGGAPTPGRAAL
ncbi:Uncharacterised protein [Bordetella parapertussis]|nr:Uncharacterised protein [Bordetella parapertussis]SUV59080.1 Uncharacterised protein [Bordetella parapertussis]SUV79728.1 Uncharacterised protein [Bordetella parapertussis]VEF52394.1 Uncharacterised protein [Bordetella parapertussis]VTR29430.1 Uncharacterised protein [Bordetella parapertussis]